MQSTDTSSFAVSLFYTTCLAFVAGVGVGTFVMVSVPAILWGMTIVFALAFIARRAGDVATRQILLMMIMIGIGFSLGLTRSSSNAENFGQSVLQSQVGMKITETGVVVREPEERTTTQQLFIETEAGDTLLVSVDRYQAVAYGDQVIVTGTLKLPESFTTDLGRQFNYPGYLKAKGVEYQIAFADLDVVASGHGSALLRGLYTLKQRLMEQIETALPEPASGLGEGLLLGVKQALGTELEEAFRTTGLTHIVVLSGYNIMLVVVFVMFLLRRVLPPRPRVIVGVLAITLFALMVGLSATVVRASGMAILLLIATALGRMYLVLRSLIIAGVMMIAINPLVLVYDIGFQFSFMATLGLIIIAPVLERLLHTPSWLAPLKTFFLATVATQIAVLPLLLYHIGEVSLVALIANVLVLPMVPIAMLLTFLVSLVGFAAPVAVPLLALPAFFSLTYITTIASYLANVPFAALSVPSFPVYGIFITYTLLGFILWQVRHLFDREGFSEIGETLLVESLHAPKTRSELERWTIVEETEVPSRIELEKTGTDTTSTPVSGKALPIYFR